MRSRGVSCFCGERLRARSRSCCGRRMDGQITHVEGECNLHRTSSHVDPLPYAPTAAGIEGAAQARAGGNLRWLICALLFFATTINYMDRQVFGLLAPDLQKLFNWNEIQYANIVTCFYATY